MSKCLRIQKAGMRIFKSSKLSVSVKGGGGGVTPLKGQNCSRFVTFSTQREKTIDHSYPTQSLIIPSSPVLFQIDLCKNLTPNLVIPAAIPNVKVTKKLDASTPGPALLSGNWMWCENTSHVICFQTIGLCARLLIAHNQIAEKTTHDGF